MRPYRWVLLALIIFMLPAPLWAAEPVTELNYGGLLLRMVLGLIAVCAIAALVLKYGLGRLAPQGSVSKHLEILERAPLEPRRSLIIVRVADRALVVGSSEHGLQTLTELPYANLVGEGVEFEQVLGEADPKMFHVKQSEEALT